MIIAPVDAIAELFGSAGASDYLGEPVTVAAHLLQAGALAEAAGAPPALAAAALLHVPAKRYLCAVEPDYFGRPSAASMTRPRTRWRRRPASGTSARCLRDSRSSPA